MSEKITKKYFLGHLKICEMAHPLRYSSKKPLKDFENVWDLFSNWKAQFEKKENMWSLPMAYSIQRYVIFMCVKLIHRETVSQTKAVFLGH